MRRRRSSAPAPAAPRRRRSLAEAGLDVIVLEAGGHYNRDSYPTDQLEAIATLYRDGGLTIAEGRPPIPVPVARTVGGTTVINSGTCFRAPEHGARATGASGYGSSGRATSTPTSPRPRSSCGSPRSTPSGWAATASWRWRAAQAIGVSGGPISRNAGDCVQCSSCPFGCRIDAKRGMHVSYLPRAVAAGARLRAGVEARRVLVEDGRAAGVGCRGRGAGRTAAAAPYTVRARRATIVAGGALGTPELLQRSGLGGDQVGAQPPHPPRLLGRRPLRGGGARLGGRDAELLRRRVGERAGPARGDLHAAPVRRRLAARAPGASTRKRCSTSATIGSIGVQLADHSGGPGRPAGDGSLRTTYRLTEEDARRIGVRHRPRRRSPLRRRRDRGLPQHRRGPGCCDPGELAGVRGDRGSGPRSCGSRPSTRWAPRGSPADPATGVCAADGSVNGVADLYVADASLFPTAVGVNPMMTIIAFAKQVAAGIAGRGPGGLIP